MTSSNFTVGFCSWKIHFEIFQGWFILLDFQGSTLFQSGKKLNGEGGIWTLAPLLTTYSLSRGAPSAAWVLLHVHTLKRMRPNSTETNQYLIEYLRIQRRGWDSNPCAREGKRFSRPPRYDHFDTSPRSLITHYFTPTCFSSAQEI